MGEAKPGASPDERLARIIADRLARDGVIPGARLKELEQKLAAGMMKEADWRLMVEMAAPEANEVDNNARGNPESNAEALPRGDEPHGADV